MFGLGKNKDEQKMWNFLIVGFPGTDEECYKAAPGILIATIILVVLILIFL